MNTGIQDAVNLGWKLAFVSTGRASPSLLDSYEPEREPVGRRVLRFTDRAFTAATSTSPLVRFIRARLVPLVLPLAMRSRRARALGFRTVSQLGIRYRRSPLSVDGPNPPRRGPKPGDRLPDASLTDGGQLLTLHGAVSAPGFHAVLCGPAAAWPTDVVAELEDRYTGRLSVHRVSRDGGPGVQHDHAGEAAHRLGLRDSSPVHYLVRPDGHIAYRGTGGDLTGLRAYLERWLGSGEQQLP